MSNSAALDRSRAILADATSLLDHHPAKSDPSPGRPAGPGYGHLLRAGVSLCYTAWEVYVEEALVEQVEALTSCGAAVALPQSLRDWVAKKSSDPWLFVDDGWATETVRLVAEQVRGDGSQTFGLNTANVKNVTRLYSDVLGFSPLDHVSWQRKSTDAVKADIALLVSVRGEIVHKGTTPGALSLTGVRSWLNFVTRLCDKFDAELAAARTPMMPAATV